MKLLNITIGYTTLALSTQVFSNGYKSLLPKHKTESFYKADDKDVYSSRIKVFDSGNRIEISGSFTPTWNNGLTYFKDNKTITVQGVGILEESTVNRREIQYKSEYKEGNIHKLGQISFKRGGACQLIDFKFLVKLGTKVFKDEKGSIAYNCNHTQALKQWKLLPTQTSEQSKPKPERPNNIHLTDFMPNNQYVDIATQNPFQPVVAKILEDERSFSSCIERYVWKFRNPYDEKIIDEALNDLVKFRFARQGKKIAIHPYHQLRDVKLIACMQNSILNQNLAETISWDDYSNLIVVFRYNCKQHLGDEIKPLTCRINPQVAQLAH
ncbi:MAG: hypothetical protein HRU19_16935 [Pseudobacteriovorax sp.]|nr:hypothetical protein [Pseudobacteriovorax sp.]